MQTKKCTQCGKSKELNPQNFYKHKNSKDGYDQKCKLCVNERNRIYYSNPDNLEKKRISDKRYYEENKDEYLAKQNEYRRADPEKFRASVRKSYHKHKDKYNANKDPEKVRERNKEYNSRPEVKEYRRNYVKTKLHTDINYRIAHNLRKRTRRALKTTTKDKSTIDYLGCTIGFLKKHLKKQFKPGMSFDNYGSWHIDHIVPVVKFDLNIESEREKCFHYSNLQPLWAVENLSKGART